MNRPDNVVPMHRGVCRMRGEDMARATRDPNAVFERDDDAAFEQEIYDFMRPRVSEGAWLLIGAIVALLVVFTVFAEQVDAALGRAL